MRLSYYISNAEKLPKTFCSLAEKSFYAGERVHVITKDEEFAKGLDSVLWTYSKKHFIPHALKTDPHQDSHPIIIDWNSDITTHDSNIIFTVNLNTDMVLEVLSSLKSSASNLHRLIFLEDEPTVKANSNQLEQILRQSEFGSSDLEKFIQNSNGSWQKL